MLRRVVERLNAESEPASAAELASRLRPIYPRIAVFERQLSGERAQFYVYRGGRYEPDRTDPWWEEPGAPRARVSESTGRITAVTGEYAELMRASEGDLVGRHFVELVLPEAQVAAETMFEVVTEEREVRSEALVVRRDGSTLPIAFRAIRRDGEVEVWYRPLEG